jgi:hypothetical protein
MNTIIIQHHLIGFESYEGERNHIKKELNSFSSLLLSTTGRDKCSTAGPPSIVSPTLSSPEEFDKYFCLSGLSACSGPVLPPVLHHSRS